MGSSISILQLDLPQLEMVLSRESVRSLGITSRDVAMAVNVLSGGYDVARYNDDPGDGERYDVRLKAGEGQLAAGARPEPHLHPVAGGELVRLDNLARLDPGLGPAVVSRYDLQYSATFLGTPTMAEAAAIARCAKFRTADAVGYRVKMTGRSEEFGKTCNYMLFAFVTAMILVYMVLASQFNSFIQPLIIMVAQPLAIIGGVGALWLTGHSLNIYSMIGLVLLVGLVAKNSILLVDLTNQMRTEGMAIDEALRNRLPDAHAARSDDIRHDHPGPVARRDWAGCGFGYQWPAGRGRDRRPDQFDPADAGGGSFGLFPGGTPGCRTIPAVTGLV